MLASTGATIIGVNMVHKRAKKYSGPAKSRQKSQNRDIKFAVTMIFLNILFLLFKIPNFVIFIANFSNILDNLDTDSLAIFSYLYVILLSLYFAIDFPIQLLVNSLVRQEFCRLFRTNYVLAKLFGTNITLLNKSSL